MRPSLLRLVVARPPPSAPVPTTPYTPHRLPCTAPPTSSHLILHLPHPPPSWPAKFAPLPGVTLPDIKAGADAPEMRVLYAWDGVGTAPLPGGAEDGQVKGKEVLGRWYRPGKATWEGPVDLEAADLVGQLGRTEVVGEGSKREGWDIYVCTHGTRDCRCAEAGGGLVDRLREELKKGGKEAEETVRVWEVSHLGGHKFAANALVFDQSSRTSHLYGNLRPSHAPLILSALLSPQDPSAYPLIPRELLPSWRGRTGLTKEEMKVFWVAASGSPPPPPEVAAEEVKKEEAGKGKVKVTFETWQGEVIEVEGEEGESVMDLGKREGLEAMEGVCGGVLECATCHCFLPPSPTTSADAPVPALTDEEEDMLINAMSPKPTSRLGCQIKLTPALGEWCAEGGRIGLPRF